MKSTNELTAPISNWMKFGTKGKLNIIIAFANFQCLSSPTFRIMAIPSAQCTMSNNCLVTMRLHYITKKQVKVLNSPVANLSNPPPKWYPAKEAKI